LKQEDKKKQKKIEYQSLPHFITANKTICFFPEKGGSPLSNTHT